MGLVALQPVEFLQTKGQTHVSSIDRWILNHWITREVPHGSSDSLLVLYSLFLSLNCISSLSFWVRYLQSFLSQEDLTCTDYINRFACFWFGLPVGSLGRKLTIMHVQLRIHTKMCKFLGCNSDHWGCLFGWAQDKYVLGEWQSVIANLIRRWC